MTTKTLTGVYATTYDLTSPVTTLSISSTGYLGAGVVAAGVNAYTVVNNGHVRGKYLGIGLTGGGVVTNAGTIVSYSTTTSGAGVILGNGGTVSNLAGGLIEGYYGVQVGGQAGTVNNQGVIFGYGKEAVDLKAGGQVTNGSTTNTAATIRGVVGLYGGLSTTLTNFGSVIGSGTAGVGGYLKNGGTITNGSSSDTHALIAGAIGAAILGNSGTVHNYGTIISNSGTYGAGVALEGGGVITNGSSTDTTALVDSAGKYAIASIGLAATVTNYGTVLAGYAGGSAVSAAVYLKNGGAVTNGSTKDKTAHIGATVGVIVTGSTGTIINFATIGGAFTEIGAAVEYGGRIVNGSSTDTTALIQAYVGAAGVTHAATVINYGTILAGGGPGTFSAMEGAVLLEAGGSVTNGTSVDTKALMKGVIGVEAQTIVATVTNFGQVIASEIGVALYGGKLTNGTTKDITATISGGLAGVAVGGAAATVTNFGTIRGGVTKYFGVSLGAGGVITNGSSTDHTALIEGYIGVGATGPGKITNDGTISGVGISGSYGASITAGVSLTNSAGAEITGNGGVSVGAMSTVTNFGIIVAGGGYSVQLTDPTARLNAEAGSSFVGTVSAGSGVVDVVSGVALASAITSHGKIEGAGTLQLQSQVSYFDAGVSLLVSKIELTGASTVARVETKLGDSRIWDQTAGTLFVNSGDLIDFTGSGNTFSGTVTGLGTVEMVGGSAALTNLTLSAGKMVISKSTVTLSGTIDLTKSISVTTPNLIVANAGASLTGGGTILLSNAATNSIHGASAAATLTNGDTIKGAGKLGGGVMTLVNDTAGIIESGYSTALTIDTGAKTITNAGVIEALTGGGIIVSSAVSNTGTLMAFNGTLTVNGAVTGAGIVKVVGGLADFTGAFNEKVDFGASGRLVLAHSQTYGGTIAGFSHTGTTSMDLADIAFSGATTATYSGTATAGVLTVSDGTHTANIHLSGNYLTASWELSAAVGGGTHIIDPTAPKPAVTPLVAAMASFGASNAGSTPSTLPAWMTGAPMLAGPSGSRG